MSAAGLVARRKCTGSGGRREPQRCRHRISREAVQLDDRISETVHCDDSHVRATVDVKAILSDPGIEGNPLEFLKVTEAYWKGLRNSTNQPHQKGPTVITTSNSTIEAPEYDICVCGGTLGILLALALQLRGHRVCVVERRRVDGRAQEWNSSRAELKVLVSLGLLDDTQLETAIVSEWEIARIGFKGMEDLHVKKILNLGVDPQLLIGLMKDRFLEGGGAIFERTSFQSAVTSENGVTINVIGAGASVPVTAGDTNRANAVDAADYSVSPTEQQQQQQSYTGVPSLSRSKTKVGRGRKQVNARLLVDCMGHYSPIVKQMRGGAKPEGMVLVVGSCADGIAQEANTTSDFLYTFTDAENDMQLFWEAFPAAGGGRTTYMFAYADADKRRPSFEELLAKYFRLLPQYQGTPLSQLQLRRVLFGGFPSYAAAPLRPGFDRVLQVGDASACQSPISFGGFGSMLRHLPRLTDGISETLAIDRLDRSALALLQPYQPSLSASWLFQRSMSMKTGQLQQSAQAEHKQSKKGWIPADHINRLMRCNFGVMQRLGDSVMRPFLQDTIQFWPLVSSMLGMSMRDPIVVARVMIQVGPKVLLGWMRHYFALAAYTLLNTLIRPLALRSGWFRLRRWADAWCWGSGHDGAKPPVAAAVHPESSVVSAEKVYVDEETVMLSVPSGTLTASFAS